MGSSLGRRHGRRRPTLPEVALAEVGIHALSESECVRHVLDQLDAKRGGWMISQDLDHLRRMVQDPAFRELTNQADLRVPDGRITLWACRLQRTPVPEPVSGPNVVWSLSRGAAQRGHSVFLLGGRPNAARLAAQELERSFEDLQVAGWASPERGFEENPIAIKQLRHELGRSRPKIVYVGYEAPVAEAVIEALRDELPRSWWVGIGSSFSFVSGEFRRPPRWMTKSGLEWVHRLFLEPRTQFRRCVLQGIPFAVGLLTQSALRGMLPKPKQSGTFGRKRPRALLVDDDPFALSHLELLLNESFPEVEVETRTVADVSGDFDFYFLDNDFDGRALAGEMAMRIRRERPEARIFAFSGALDVDALKRLINAGCDGVCEKERPETWKDALDRMRETLEERAARHKDDKRAFGGVRHAAGSIHGLLEDWNQRASERTTAAEASREEPSR